MMLGLEMGRAVGPALAFSGRDEIVVEAAPRARASVQIRLMEGDN